MTILGISIGTTRTGVAVLKDDVLLDRQIHRNERVWSDNKLRMILNLYKQYVVKRSVQAIVVKIPPPKKLTPPLKRLLRRIEALAKKHGCDFDLTTKNELKHVTGVRSTIELVKYTTLLYPELAPVFDKGVDNNHMYHRKLFEAVLSAYIYSGRQQLKSERIKNTTE